MSTVSGVSSSSALSWIKKTRGASASSSTTSSAPPTRPAGGDFQSKIDAALSDQGLTGTKLSDLRTQIQDAVEKARSDGGDGASGTPDDARAAVKSAVDDVLKRAGVDVEKFDSDLKPTGKRGGPHGPPPTDAPSDGDGDDSSSTGGTSGTTASSFDAYLKSSGIDPDQFKRSILASLQSGSTDFSAAFSGASVGSSVDLVA